MSASLAEKIRRARESKVEVGRFTFIITRPTDIEMALMYKSGREANKHDVARDHVIGWAGVKEADILPGGQDEDIKFDNAAWIEWCSDDQTLWAPIYEAVIESFMEHSTNRDESAKN
jgi:hypothetical protein